MSFLAHSTYASTPEELLVMLSWLKKIVNLSSQTNDLKGVLSVQNFLAVYFKNLGFKAKLIENPEADSAPLLSLRFDRGQKEDISFVLHSDTVNSVKEVGGFHYDPSRDLAFGCGIADMKGGIVVLMNALKQFLNRRVPLKYNLNIIVSPNEEKGSIGFHNYFMKMGIQSRYVFCFEPSLECGGIIGSRNGNRWYNLKTYAESFHTGRTAKGTMNSTHAFMHTFNELYHSINEFDDLKFNVSSLKTCGDHYNKSSASLTAKIDVRFIKNSSLEFFDDLLHKSLRKNSENRFETSIVDDCPSMSAKTRDLLLEQVYLRDLKKQEGKAYKVLHSEGCSDINYFQSFNNICLDGLGAVGWGMHEADERIRASRLLTRSNSLEKALVYLCR